MFVYSIRFTVKITPIAICPVPFKYGLDQMSGAAQVVGGHPFCAGGQRPTALVVGALIHMGLQDCRKVQR